MKARATELMTRKVLDAKEANLGPEMSKRRCCQRSKVRFTWTCNEKLALFNHQGGK